MIKTETCALAQKRHATYKQEKKARSYSKKCKRKTDVKRVGIVVLVAVISFGIGLVGKDQMMVEKAEAGLIDKSTLTDIKDVNEREMDAVLVEIADGCHVLQTSDGNQWNIQDPPEVWYEITIDNNGTPDDFKDDVVTGLDFLE